MKRHFPAAMDTGGVSASMSSASVRRAILAPLSPNLSAHLAWSGNWSCWSVLVEHARGMVSKTAALFDEKTMIRKAFVMQINVGAEEEYARRHQPIWPALQEALKNHGVHNYSIFCTKKRGNCLLTSRSKAKSNGRQSRPHRYVGNGGVIWPNSCLTIPTAHPLRLRSQNCSILD